MRFGREGAVDEVSPRSDFLDIFALGTQGLSLGEMLDLYRRKFSVTDVIRVLGSLCYFDDADPEPMPTMLTNSTWPEVRTVIRDWVKAVANAV